MPFSMGEIRMKTFGILLLSVIPLLLSLRAGEEIRLASRQRSAFLKLLTQMRFQIENFSRDQKEIFNDFDSPVLRKTPFYEELQNRLETEASGAFGYAWKRYGEQFSFDPESRELLDRLAEHFGFLEKEAQLFELGCVINHLEKNESGRKAECENKIKILRISGLTAGLGIFILLI